MLLPAKECGLAADSKAQAEQVRSVAVSRIRSYAGRLPASLLDRLNDALATHLAL